MSVATFFEKLMGLQQQKAQATIAGYRELVAGIATGEEPGSPEVERVLVNTGKSIDDLRRDVEAYQHRMALKAMVSSLPDLDRDFAEVQKQIAAADRELQEAERRHDDATAPLYGRMEDIKQARSEASRAQQELFDTCSDPDLERQLDRANDELARLLEANKDLATHAAWLDNKSDAERDRIGKELTEADREHRREQAALYRKQAESLRRQIKVNEKAQGDIIKQRVQIEDHMRQW
jgi:chromosome segregation ATPase